MSWRKHFTSVDNSGLPLNVTGKPNEGGGPGAATSRYASWLPEVYAGSPNRLMRYIQYDQMDNDLEINAALDIIAEFCSQDDDYTNLPFVFKFTEDPSETEMKILSKTLDQWCNNNELRRRAFKMVRNTLKYGDQFFIRDPETQKWFYVDPSKVVKIIVNESEGKKPEQYVIKDININLQNLSVATKTNTDFAANPATGMGGTGGGGTGGIGGNGGSGIVILRYLGNQKGTGGTISFNNGYTYHTFISSGTFTG